MSADYYRRCIVVIDAGKAESKALCRRLCPWGPLEGLYVLGGGIDGDTSQLGMVTYVILVNP